MSVLIEALERIREKLLKYKPEVASKLQPGLNRQEIEELVKDFPFSLPEEVYELYQWHNGTQGARLISSSPYTSIMLYLIVSTTNLSVLREYTFAPTYIKGRRLYINTYVAFVV